MKHCHRWGLAAVLGTAACGGSDGGPRTIYSLEKVVGDSQFVAVMTASAPLVVRVVDESGDPAAGIVVGFAVTSEGGPGRGSATAQDTTDAAGLARAIYTAGPDAGIRRVRASVGQAELLFTVQANPGTAATIKVMQGQDQGADAGTPLLALLGARVEDRLGNVVPGAQVVWRAVAGGGGLTADTTFTDGAGVATVGLTLGTTAGGNLVLAWTPGAPDTLRFHATARRAMTVTAGGNNVPLDYTSDLWVTGTHAYTGTWASGWASLKVWDVSGAVTLDTSITVAGGTVSDNEVSSDGALLLATSETGGSSNGLYVYSLLDPARPALIDSELVATGLHTGTFADIGGQRYIFAAKNPSAPALMVFRIQPDSADKIVQVAALAQPATYGIHDQFVRDGLAFVSVWNAGMRIYDVGDGRLGGSPTSPQLIGSIVTAANGASCNCVHNAWWYHDPNGGKRYLFIGQEGPGSIGSSSSGDIHVVDLSDMAAPREVAFYHLAGAGTHNFWMDETRGILYAAYYNAGVVALDVTGTLAGNLANREIARLRPGGAGNTYVWGVQLANGALWASDMVSGFWKLSVP